MSNPRKVVSVCKCGEHLVKSEGDDKFILRSKVLIIEKGICLAVCPSCKGQVELPLEAAISLKTPKLYVKK